MKRTTYILIGLLASGIIVIMAVCFTVLLTSERRSDTWNTLLGAEPIEKELSGVHTLRMIVNQEKKSKRVYLDGMVRILPCSDSQKEKITYPESPYLNVVQRNDTLFIELDLDAYKRNEEIAKNQTPYLRLVPPIRLNVNQLVAINTEMEGVELVVENMKADSLAISSRNQKVVLDSCQLRSLNAAGHGLRLHAKDSKIGNYYLNLDGVWEWTLENTQIDTEYLTGKGSHSNELKRGECRRMIWTPASEKAHLTVTVYDKADMLLDTVPRTGK